MRGLIAASVVVVAAFVITVVAVAWHRREERTYTPPGLPAGERKYYSLARDATRLLEQQATDPTVVHSKAWSQEAERIREEFYDR